MPKRPKKHTKRDDNVLFDAIIEASTIAEQVLELTVRLETLKAVIREHAVPRIETDKNSINIDTSSGRCQVVLVRDHLTLAAGVEPDALQLILPGELYNTFFTTKPVLRPTATDAWLRLTKEQRAKLGDPCPFELTPRQAQVKLPRQPE